MEKRWYQSLKLYSDVLPQQTLDDVVKDAHAVAACPNYWTPKDVVTDESPAKCRMEQAIQTVYKRVA